jgi:hypothetical protein
MKWRAESNWVRFVSRRRTVGSVEDMGGALFGPIRLLMAPQSYTSAAAVLVDELNAGGL